MRDFGGGEGVFISGAYWKLFEVVDYECVLKVSSIVGDW
jgi:hypothetical protein